MDRMVQWLAKHIDGRLTPTGVVLILAMTISGIVGLVCISAGNTFFAALFITIFVVIFSALGITALRTDTTLKLTKQERAAIWGRTPTFMKLGVGIFIGGELLNLAGQILFPGNTIGMPFSSAAFALGLAIIARGMQTEKPPLPRPRQEPLNFESSPEQYMQHARPIVLGFYFSAVVFLLMALLRLWK